MGNRSRFLGALILGLLTFSFSSELMAYPYRSTGYGGYGWGNHGRVTNYWSGYFYHHGDNNYPYYYYTPYNQNNNNYYYYPYNYYYPIDNYSYGDSPYNW